MKIQFNLENKRDQREMGGSTIIKLVVISILTLILLVPSSWLESLIAERQNRKSEVLKEISENWSGTQELEGPVLVIPYKTIHSIKDSLGVMHTGETISNIYILPENLFIQANMSPIVLHRGIFDDVVYNSHIQFSGNFSKIERKRSGLIPENILWDKAKLDIGLSDMKGIGKSFEVNLDNQKYTIESDPNSLNLFPNNLVINSDLTGKKESDVKFSFEMDLKGSESLSFLQIGKSTSVNVQGNWGNPSFFGHYLPEKRKVSKNEFEASWNLPFFNRPFPQQWVDKNMALENKEDKASFGVKLELPVDQYQETTRTAKYSILIIILSFLALFITELLKKSRIHPLHYVLIGFSLIIFYLLLLSLSEQVGFKLAYLLSAISTIALIGTFVSTLIRNKVIGLLFSGILAIFYGFVFIIIQLQDMALLVGSIALFLLVALLMYFSTRLPLNQGENLSKQENQDQD